ncbi:1-propanol dehydrogenase PduQ [Brotaphodocola sp.]|uniref:1-propanol dehydrogenase PduQ n=1 Tax=Brotaphodocola sp. TaxID=3073577 RepID=UPI003D7C377B
MGQFLMSTRVYMGESSMEEVKSLGIRRAYIICDPFMEKCGRAGELAGLLAEAGAKTEIFSKVVPDPSIEVVTMAIQGMKAMQPDAVLALGGGSAIDTAKAASHLYASMNSGEKPMLIAVPTTSGTGSEVTSFAVISDTQAKAKYALVDQSLVPDVALLDPNLTASVPPSITADTGMDVLTHGLEAYVSTKADDFTDACAEKAIKLVWEYLERAVSDGSDMEAREHMHNASCLAGIAFSNASLGICHSLAHALGAHFHIPHGRANALLLTHVIGYNAGLELAEDSETLLRYEKIANMLGIGGGTPKAAAYGLIRQIKNLMQRIHIPAYVTDLNVEREAFEAAIPEMAKRAMEDNCTVTNPRTPALEDLENLYKNLCKGGPV